MAIEEGELYQDPLLTNVAVKFKNEDFVGDRVLWPVPVPKKTFKYLKWGDEIAYDVIDTLHVPAGSANEFRLSATKLDGNTETHALVGTVDPEEQEQAGGEIPLAAITTEALVDKILLKREVDISNQLRSTAVLTTNTTLVGAAQWSDPDSDPLAAFEDAIGSLPNRPDFILAGQAVVAALKTHPTITKSILAQQGVSRVDLKWLAAYFGVDEFIEGDAWMNTAKKGQAINRQRIWGKDCIAGYRGKSIPSPMMDRPCVGYLPTRSGGGTAKVRVYTTRVATRGTGSGVLWVKAETDYGILITAPANAFLFKSAVA